MTAALPEIAVEFPARQRLAEDSLVDFTGEDVKGTPSLWNADLDDAYRYGGEVTRAALSVCRLRGDRRYTVVDTKIHMLMPGMLPAIPGWHTDGIPRAADGNPGVGGPPLLDRLLALDPEEEARPRYHLVLIDTGTGSLTEFLADAINLMLPAEPTPDLYAVMTRQINERISVEDQPFGRFVPRFTAPSGVVVEFDWMSVHRATPATGSGWRFLARVTETDWLTPQSDLRSILRLHNPVYVPEEYGW